MVICTDIEKFMSMSLRLVWHLSQKLKDRLAVRKRPSHLNVCESTSLINGSTSKTAIHMLGYIFK